jgi:transcriptional regulator with XRE-family HTH domain
MKNKDETYKYIGGKIKEAREAEGLSQKQLAEKTGFESATAISLIEAGERKVSINNLEKIAKALQHDINFFLGNYEIPSTNIRYALRADKNLTGSDQKEIMQFIDYVRNRDK